MRSNKIGMKAIIILIPAFLLFSFKLPGQQDKELKSWSQNQDTVFNRKPDIFYDRNKYPDKDRFPRNFNPGRTKKRLQDSIAEKRFPGSSRYYSKSFSSSAYGSGFGKSFIVVPDTTEKHFLIIKNPLSGAITK